MFTDDWGQGLARKDLSRQALECLGGWAGKGE
jgi:hypothetical protein